MRTALLIIVGAALAGCAGPQLAHPPDTRSWTERMLDAQEHERRAAAHEQAATEAEERSGPAAYNCGDVDLNDQLTTGGRRITTWQPCFDIAEEAAMHHRDLAARERAAARYDYATAQQLVRAEGQACAPIPVNERDHSVFAHRKEIAEIIPHREAAELRGVWIVFKPTPGLTASWVRQDIACQRAQWAVRGYKPDGNAMDPTLVRGADVRVVDRAGHIEVLVTTPDTLSAEIALARAMNEPGPLGEQPAETATRESLSPRPQPR